jgi:hypothetical protein
MNTEIRDQLLVLLQRRKADAEERWRVGSKLHPLTLKPMKKSDLIDSFPKGATVLELDEFSARNGVELPTGLRDWLMLTNGAAGFYGVPPVDPRLAFESVWEYQPDWKQRSWIPVANDGFGNHYVQVPPGANAPSVQPICFVEALSSAKVEYVVASDMPHFALFYLEEEFVRDKVTAPTLQMDADQFSSWLQKGTLKRALPPWPFDKKYTLSRDPNLVQVEDLPLPWK